MTSEFDVDFFLNEIGIQQINTNMDFILPPYRMSPQCYVGLNNNSQSQPSDDISLSNIDVLRMDPTMATSTISPVRDLLTGEITHFEDSPISSVSLDDSSINRPICSNTDSYHLGSNSGVSFLPGGFSSDKNQNSLNVDQYIRSLETGQNLLLTPFDKKLSLTENEMDDLPSLPEFNEFDHIKASPTPKATAQQIVNDITKTYAVEDKWDVSLFSQEIPTPALTFPYKLDPFQLRAIHRLELNQCVFVSAPTSAGKTVVAQYAIALCRSHKMKALYTSPIKALSNQKFRDLTKQFGDVGILTGDVSLNREASCLILTTEILRSMLYKGADILRDVECVIFDECHYIANDERGVVWEEAIILMPYHINMVFLSATVPNAKEIADWIGRTKQRTVYVEEYNVRPVPIEHALYTGDTNFYVLGRNGRSIDSSKLLDAQLSIVSDRKEIDVSSMYWIKFVLSAESAKLLPILIFCFSQRMCEELASNLLGLDLLTKNEKSYVNNFCRKALLRLNKEDRELPQIMTVFSLLEIGVGVHHGGVLPIVKEIVEILLAEGFIKVLFCTSTFAMGLNVPARSCAFISLKKFNGKIFTELTPTEYVQMSGRAGRRGLDTVGTSIILCWNEIPNIEYLRTLMSGKVEALQSQFKLKFNMILNLLRVKDIKMVDILRRSLSANLIQATMPQLLKKLNELEKEIKKLPKIECPFYHRSHNVDIEDCTNYMEDSFGDSVYDMKCYSQDMMGSIDSHSVMNQLRKGRVVYVVDDKSPSLVVIQDKPANQDEIRAINSKGKEITFSINDIGAIFQKPSKSAQKLRNNEIKTFLENVHKNEQPLEWTKIFSTSEFEFTQASKHQVECYREVSTSPCFNCLQLEKHLSNYNEKFRIISEIQHIQKEIADESLAFKPLLDNYVKCLQDLQYVTNDNVLMLKGRVSIEINSCHEVLATEFLFSGLFDSLSPVELASCVAALVSEGIYNKEMADLIPPTLIKTFEQMVSFAKVLEQTFAEHNILLEERWVDNNVNLTLVQAVYDWAEGRSFKDIMYITDVPEGLVVRTINRISEALRDFANATKIMGCLELSNKFEIAMEIIKRDIIFASSLYFD